MAEEKRKILFCKGGGCTAKLGPDALRHVLGMIPKGKQDPDLLIGYDTSDDAAVYRVSEDRAIVQTLDFFPPMIEDPYTFGRVAAANALSDVFAMGGTPVTALNIVCFPQDGDLNILGEILRGGAEKVQEAGASLCGGHSIQDPEVKYGLSVTGLIDPKKVLANRGAVPGDLLILTKPLGTGIVCTADRVGGADRESMEEAIRSMTTLNRYAAEIFGKYTVHAMTDVTGFGLLGHLSEMLGDTLSAELNAARIPFLKHVPAYVDAFYLTANGQRNRNHMEGKAEFRGTEFWMEELLFDPQTSGGLLAAVSPDQAEDCFAEIRMLGLPCGIIGRVTARQDMMITIENK